MINSSRPWVRRARPRPVKTGRSVSTGRSFRRFQTGLLVAGFMLAFTLWLGGALPSAIADAPQAAVVAQAETTPIQPGKLRIADEIAASTLEEDFGKFNLFIIFFVTLGPLKVIPTFMQVTRHASTALKRQLALRSTAISTAVIMIVMFIGQSLLRGWQIQLPALMIAGGILLSLVALRLILTQYTPNPPPETAPESPGLHLAITPLAFPSILPPFGIAIALTLMVLSTALGLEVVAVIALLLLVMVLNLLSMLAAEPILKFIRPVTLKILGYTLGVMQFALGIQFILVGLEIQALVIQLLLRGQ